MGQISYQRPREKLYEKGAQALSSTELFQIIISSGGHTATAARIAKSVISLYRQGQNPSYQDLLSIHGLGHAKVAQVIAAVELGRRFTGQTLNVGKISQDFSELKFSRKRTLKYVTINGAGKVIKERLEPISDTAQTLLVIKRMFADALHDYADSMLIGIGSRTYDVEMLNDEMLNALKMIFDTAALLEIKVNDVWLINQTTQQTFHRKTIL
jgi:DNA repair proteins